jgi:hypothetical protein
LQDDVTEAAMQACKRKMMENPAYVDKVFEWNRSERMGHYPAIKHLYANLMTVLEKDRLASLCAECPAAPALYPS